MNELNTAVLLTSLAITLLPIVLSAPPPETSAAGPVCVSVRPGSIPPVWVYTCPREQRSMTHEAVEEDGNGR